MRTILVTAVIVATASSCIPDGAKRKIDEQLIGAHEMMADMQFKNALANIELHKTRYGRYPQTLKDLKFLSATDSSFIGVEYFKLDSGYELNLTYEAATFSGTAQTVSIKYPDEFWQGLGCVKSNLKPD